MPKHDITIYHNPRCSKSRKTLEIIRDHGVEPTIVEYLNTPPSPQELEAILALLAMEPRAVMRTGEADYRENGFADTRLTATDLIRLMSEHPRVIERPIVTSQSQAVIGRPPENVLKIIK